MKKLFALVALLSLGLFTLGCQQPGDTEVIDPAPAPGPADTMPPADDTMPPADTTPPADDTLPPDDTTPPADDPLTIDPAPVPFDDTAPPADPDAP